ncbi:hypothetical protein [Chitinophaga sp. S165]|uniref:hypothetical protein n=1 Tax=Chitinophaga sp. S165 TaxID=2135462 RepID=UPI000D98A651|nr:hypothetical protein [Chitinophaga sp. S165]PWV47050.1 hypothetical protein C7475_109138 [Chitinophaga sp. S165]
MKIEMNEIGDPNAAQFFVKGIVFNIDYKTCTVYPQKNPRLATSFEGATAKSGYVHAVFNSKTDSIERKVVADQVHETNIMLPEILFKDPIKDDETLNKINRQCFKDNAGFVIANQTIINRLSGHLRQVDIMNTKYFLDIRLEELRNIHDFTRSLSFKDFYQTSDKVTAWYDAVKKQIADIEPDYLTRTPKNVYLIELPTWFRLDPVSYARIDNSFGGRVKGGDAAYLNEVMMEVNPVAKATHISQTFIAKTILKNRQQCGLPPEKMRVIPPNKTKGRKLK